MTMTHNEIIEVVAAHRDGKVVQYRNYASSNGWMDYIGDGVKPPCFMHDYVWRIKPEPRKAREFSVMVRKPDGAPMNVWRYPSAACPYANEESETFRVREVLEDGQ